MENVFYSTGVFFFIYVAGMLAATYSSLAQIAKHLKTLADKDKKT